MVSAVQPLCAMYAKWLAVAARNSAILASAGMGDAAEMQMVGAGGMFKCLVAGLLECGRQLERAEAPVARLCNLLVDGED